MIIIYEIKPKIKNKCIIIFLFINFYEKFYLFQVVEDKGKLKFDQTEVLF